MATTIVGRDTGAVPGGIDTHLDVHVAAALDEIGGLLGVESFGRRERATASFVLGQQALRRLDGSVASFARPFAVRVGWA